MHRHADPDRSPIDGTDDRLFAVEYPQRDATATIARALMRYIDRSVRADRRRIFPPVAPLGIVKGLGALRKVCPGTEGPLSGTRHNHRADGIIGIGLITSAVIFLVPPLINQAQRLIQVIPNTNSLQSTFNQLLEAYRQTVPDTVRTTVDQGLGNALQTIQANISQYIQTALGFIVTRLLQVVSLISFIVGLLVIPIWLFYLLNDQRKARIGLNRVLNFRIRPDFWNVWGIVDGSLSAYIRGQVTLGTIIGVSVGVGLAIIDLIPGLEIDYILLLALWAGICELIPMIGAILGGTPGVILAFVIGGPTTGVVVLIMYIVIQQLENNLLVPRIIGESVGVHPAILTVTLIVLGNLFGLAGVILAAPMTAIARDLYRYTYRRLSGLMPDEAIVTTTNT